jgi:hypothetical protein
MPILAFFGVVGFALIALLFVADATLERSSPVIVTSDRTGLPERWHPDAIQTLATAPAPAPDMTSQAVLAAQPKSEPKALKKIEPAALAARAEAPIILFSNMSGTKRAPATVHMQPTPMTLGNMRANGVVALRNVMLSTEFG